GLVKPLVDLVGPLAQLVLGTFLDFLEIDRHCYLLHRDVSSRSCRTTSPIQPGRERDATVSRQVSPGSGAAATPTTEPTPGAAEARTTNRLQCQDELIRHTSQLLGRGHVDPAWSAFPPHGRSELGQRSSDQR